MSFVNGPSILQFMADSHNYGLFCRNYQYSLVLSVIIININKWAPIVTEPRPYWQCHWMKLLHRNPKDVCVSLYHHCKGFEVFEYDGPFEEFAELFLNGKVRTYRLWMKFWITCNADNNKLFCVTASVYKRLFQRASRKAISLNYQLYLREPKEFFKEKSDLLTNYQYRSRAVTGGSM